MSEAVGPEVEAPSGERPELPWEFWLEYPGITESKYFEEYLYRLKSGRDMHTIFTAASETGVGKTTCAFVVCFICDPWGWTVEKATLSAPEYSYMYDEYGDPERRGMPGSWLMLDELELAFDSRRGMTHENVEGSHDIASKRYFQIFGAWTAPSKGWIDDRFGSDSADYWIQCQETQKGEPMGEAKVYRLKNNEHYERHYTTRTENIQWPVMDWHPEFRKLERLKHEYHQGDWSKKWYHADEVEEIKKNFWNKSNKMTRFHIIRALYENTGLSQYDISDAFTVGEKVEGVSQKTVSNITTADSFEDYYKSLRD